MAPIPPTRIGRLGLDTLYGGDCDRCPHPSPPAPLRAGIGLDYGLGSGYDLGLRRGNDAPVSRIHRVLMMALSCADTPFFMATRINVEQKMVCISLLIAMCGI